MSRLDPQFLPIGDDFPERGMRTSPDMAFNGSAYPEPADQPAADRVEWADTVLIHPATQHLHDTGFGPIHEMGDTDAPGEWRFWAVCALAGTPWIALLFWLY